MNEWCINQHGKTGLTQACIDSPHTHEEVEESVRAYLEKWIPETGAGLLAGSSVHADMRYVKSSTCISYFPSLSSQQPSLIALSARLWPGSPFLLRLRVFIPCLINLQAGRGIDNRFLMLHMPSVMKRLSYRILGMSHSLHLNSKTDKPDVSTVKVSSSLLHLLTWSPHPHLRWHGH